MFLRAANGLAQQCSLTQRHDADSGIVIEREDGDCRLADGECGRCDDGRKQPLEALPPSPQLRRDARAACMHFCADMMRDQTHDPLAIGRGHHTPAIF